MKLVDKLTEIVTEKNISTKLEDLRSYSTDASQLEGVAEAIVWPTNIEQIRRIIRLANIRTFNIVPRGAGTSLEGGTIPQNSIVLDLNRLNKIVALHRNEHYVMVEPGVTLNRLNKILQNYNLFFPIVPNSFKVCTIGGMVANNSYGNYSYRFGRISDWIMELEIVDGSGKILKIKDPTKIVGSEGTLAIIIGIKLKIIRSIENISSNMFEFNNASDMFEKIKELEQDDSVIGLEYYDKNCSKILKEQETHKLIVEYSVDLKGEPGTKQDIRTNLFNKLHKNKLHYVKNIILPKESVEAFLKFTRRNKIPTYGHIQNGIFQLYFNKTQKKVMQETMKMIKDMQGQPLNIGKSNKEFISQIKLQEMQQSKKIYDPQYILNKGKII